MSHRSRKVARHAALANNMPLDPYSIVNRNRPDIELRGAMQYSRIAQFFKTNRLFGVHSAVGQQASADNSLYSSFVTYERDVALPVEVGRLLTSKAHQSRGLAFPWTAADAPETRPGKKMPTYFGYFHGVVKLGRDNGWQQGYKMWPFCMRLPLPKLAQGADLDVLRTMNPRKEGEKFKVELIQVELQDLPKTHLLRMYQGSYTRDEIRAQLGQWGFEGVDLKYVANYITII